MGMARALVINGYFGDGTNVIVRLTDHKDIAAISTLFESASPRLNISVTRALSKGERLSTSVAGTVTIESADATNVLHYLGENLLLGDDWTVVELRGFDAHNILSVLKKRGAL
jgi:hypothetical protein